MGNHWNFNKEHLTRRPYEVRKQGKIDAIKQGNKVKSEKYLERT